MEIAIEWANAPKWGDVVHSTITLQVKFTHLCVPVLFTASADDIEKHGREIHSRALVGEFGEIASYAVPTEHEIAKRESPGHRADELRRAVFQVNHYAMLDMPEMVQKWKSYYAKVYVLDQSPTWPLVDWPEAPGE